MFRGALGRSLKDAVCIREHRECGRCDLVLACAYPRLFEPRRTRAGGRGAGPERPTPPFVLEWDAAALAGPTVTDPYALDVVLIGEGVELAPLVVPAVGRAAAAGLGERRVPHRLAGVSTVGADGVEHAGLSLATPLAGLPPLGLGSRRARLDLVTPLRLQSGGALLTRFSLEAFVRAASRRIRLLGLPEDRLPEDVPAVLSSVRVTRADVRWYDWTRRSTRQDRLMELGGLVGTVELEGDLAPLAPLLALAQAIHVGKNATFGLGRIAVTPLPRDVSPGEG